MRNTNRITKLLAQTDHHTPMQRLHQSAVAAGLSNGARNLLVKLVLWSGHRGYCWWPIPKIAKVFCRSQSSVRRWIRELRQSDLLKVVEDPGRSSFLIPYPAEFGEPLSKMEGVSTRHNPSPRPIESSFFGPGKENIQEQKTLLPEPTTEVNRTIEPLPAPEPANAFDNISQQQKTGTSTDTISIDSQIPEVPPPPVKNPPRTRTCYKVKEVDFLVDEIEQTTGDTHSRGAFIRISRNTSEQTIFQALSITRCAMEDQIVHKPGAYFLATVKALAGLNFRKGGEVAVCENRSPEAPTISLDGLQHMYAHLQVHQLWKRYCELKPEANLEHYRFFLQRNHDILWKEKPQYRRV
jgi:hypothetical protein